MGIFKENQNQLVFHHYLLVSLSLSFFLSACVYVAVIKSSDEIAMKASFNWWPGNRNGNSWFLDLAKCSFNSNIPWLSECAKRKFLDHFSALPPPPTTKQTEIGMMIINTISNSDVKCGNWENGKRWWKSGTSWTMERAPVNEHIMYVNWIEWIHIKPN